MEKLIANHEKKKFIDKITDKGNEDEKKNETNEKIFETKKDIITLEEENGSFEEELNENNEIEEKEEDSLPFFKALHKSSRI